eukprot:TRINITY_DN12027_c0_g1_i1.p1 TRINITY_DN12027_c0_g1~~TRINITY_DN12027_c0_g1_i1.p1  ORF type:complete len:444 (-),score=76.43 TRINITY_DN12027_c0_g1_i1:49-1380(-)
MGAHDRDPETGHTTLLPAPPPDASQKQDDPVEHAPSEAHGACFRLDKSQSLLLSAMFVFQFFHWFKPSQAFFPDYVMPHFHIERSRLIADVYAWDTPFQILAAGIAMVCVVVVGGHGALLVCASAAVLTVCAVLFFDSFGFLLLSQALWALSFTALFLVPAMLYWLMPPQSFQMVSSINNCAMLCASLGSSLVGFSMAEAQPELVCPAPGSSTASYRITFVLSLGSAVISLIVLLVACYNDWIPMPKTEAYPLDQYISQMRANIRSSTLLVWLCVSAVTRGVHTQVNTLWTLISLDIAPACEDQRFNALISFAAYLGAAIAVLIPARFSEFTEKYGRFVVGPCFCICGVLLVMIGAANNMLQLGLLMVVYHSCSELVLTIASAHIARAALEAVEVREQMGMQYMTAMAVKYIGALVVEMVMMLTVWPRWGLSLIHISEPTRPY